MRTFTDNIGPLCSRHFNTPPSTYCQPVESSVRNQLRIMINSPSPYSVPYSVWMLALVAFICVGAVPVVAQLAPGMIGDRPGQVATFTEPEMVQLESGVSYESVRTSGPIANCSRTWLLGTLLRTGMIDAAELRIGFEYVNESSRVSSEINHNHGLRNLSIGTKLRLLDAEASRPALFIFANARMPFGHDDYCPDAMIPGMRVQMDYDIDELATLTYSIGGEWHIGSSEMITGYAATLAVPIGAGLGVFGDYSGQFSIAASPSHACDLGVTYAVLDHLQIDVAYGLGISSTAPDHFFASGISYRVR